MALTHSQKKYLKKNLKRFSLTKIAADLNISQKEISDYLKNSLPENKYQRILHNNETVVNKKISWKSLIFLLFLVLAVYFNSLSGDFLSDDIAAISHNLTIGHFSHFLFPYLPFFSPPNFFESIIYLLFGPTPIFYHLLNVSFHLGAVLIIFILSDLLFAFPASLFIASLFAVHPLLTESVTWISGIPYTLSSLFLLWSLLNYIAAKNRVVYFFSFLAFFLGLASNEKTVVFPFVLFLYEFSFGNFKKHWPKLLPYFALSFFWAFLYLGSIGQRASILQTSFYQEPGINNPFLQIPVALSSYLKLLFFPINLSFYHTELSFSRNQYFLMLGVLFFFLIVLFYAFFKNRRIFFGLSFFLILLSPTLTPLKITWVVAERYVYLPSLGIIILIGLAIKKIGEILKSQNVSYFLFFLLLVLLSFRTIIRNFDFQNQDNLWLATAKTSPSSPQNHNNLGDLYSRRGELNEALFHFKKAIELQPNYGDAYHNLANTLNQMGKTEEAIANYQKALTLNPGLWQSYQNLAAIYFNHGNFQEAAVNLEKAIKINSQDFNLYTNLGFTYLKLGNKEKAVKNFQQALILNPQDQKAQVGLEESLK
ncbi:MAG: tetratricopeptide repeat protein [Patescibacteria group bacterium]|nr:tetratricopeptide repeat protein [Patescibacteria group bacterium]MCL5095172.1 tetratricopeptide repeat protein [Patescibacteria group bacterium]